MVDTGGYATDCESYPAECGTYGIYVSRAAKPNGKGGYVYPVEEVISGKAKKFVSPPGAELDDNIPNPGASYIHAPSHEGMIRVTAYWNPDVICFDCVGETDAPTDLCSRSVKYWKASANLLAGGVSVGERYLKSDNPDEVVAVLR